MGSPKKLLLIPLLALLYSCVPDPEYSNRPLLQFSELNYSVNSRLGRDLSIQLTFQEGDGNIGLLRDERDSLILDNNFYLNLYRKRNNQIDLYLFAISEASNTYAEFVTYDGIIVEGETFEGRLTYQMEIDPNFFAFGDSMYVETQLRDDVYNYSNILKFPTIPFGIDTTITTTTLSN